MKRTSKFAVVVIGIVAVLLLASAAFAESTAISNGSSASFVWNNQAGTSATGTLSWFADDNILQINITFNSAQGLMLTGIGLDTTPELTALSSAPTGDLTNFSFAGADSGLGSTFGISLLDGSLGVTAGSGTVYFGLSGAPFGSILINSANLRFTAADGSSQVLPGSDPQTAGAPTVPEPATLALLGTGMLGIGGLVRFKLRR